MKDDLNNWENNYAAHFTDSKHESELDQLKLHASRLETLLINLPGMAYRCLNQTYWPMDFVSSGCYELCGYSRDEIESQKVLWGEFTHPQDVNNVDKLVRSAADRGIPFEVEYRIITKEGEEKWVWERGRQVDVSADGTGILEGFITDITRMKNSEAELINAKAYADAIVESAAEGIITIDINGYIESINNAAKIMFGYTSDRLINQHSRILVASDQYIKIENFIHQDSHEHSLARFRLEIDAIKSSQQKFPAQISISSIVNPDAKKFVILIHDLTHRRAAEQEAREQRALLAHMDRLNTLGEMAAAIAHEINQPLTAISMYAASATKFLDSEQANLSRVKDALSRLSTQSHRAGAVMERMQSMTKRQNSELEIIDPAHLVFEVYKLAEPDAHVRGVKIALDVNDDLPLVKCDSIQIQQVILNLLRNGMDSMRIAGQTQNSEIIMRAEKTDDDVIISIDDCGCGISAELKKQLYLPFVSTKETGMGLGLTISRSIISAHGHKLDHYNNSRGGATFFFLFIAFLAFRS